MSKRSSLGPTIAQQDRAHERLMARQMPHTPPPPRTLTPADIDSITEALRPMMEEMLARHLGNLSLRVAR
jgi:hypothetical protein